MRKEGGGRTDNRRQISEDRLRDDRTSGGNIEVGMGKAEGGKKPELEKGLFFKEEKSLIGAIAESIARLVERGWVEAEIRKCRNKIEELIKQTE